MSGAQSSARPTQADRNRTNQQNFRRRQHQRLQELEAEVKRYRAAGVEATKEVQHAAQIVVAENTVLRDILLEEFGFDAEALQQRVQERLDRSRSISTESSATLNPNATGSAVSLHHSNDISPDALASFNNAHPMIFTSVRLQEDSLQPDGRSKPESASADPEAYIRTQSPNLSLRSCRPADGDLCSKEDPESSMKMTCEKAAEILSHLRTQHTAEEIQSELGCSPDIARTCTIENVKLMEVMGRDV